MRPIADKIINEARLKELVIEWKNAGKVIVSTNGCFDILHPGHIEYLNRARMLGDTLIACVNSDASVRKLKGPTRPLFAEKVRLEQLASLEAIDFVIPFGDDTPNRILKLIQPSIHTKGGDYTPDSLPEKGVVEAGGGRVEILPLKRGYSTTSILERLCKE